MARLRSIVSRTVSQPGTSGTSGASSAGFTLLEVLIALAIVAVALLAVIRATGQQAIASEILVEQTFAGWVASNAVTELRLVQPWPALGRSNGRSQMGGRQWYWEIDVTPTDVERMRRLDVRVFTDPTRQHSVANLAAFVGR